MLDPVVSSKFTEFEINFIKVLDLPPCDFVYNLDLILYNCWTYPLWFCLQFWTLIWLKLLDLPLVILFKIVDLNLIKTAGLTPCDYFCLQFLTLY